MIRSRFRKFVLVLPLMAGAAFPAMSANYLPMPDDMSVELADKIVENVRQILWSVQSIPIPPDVRGRTVSQLLNERVMQDAAMADIAAARKKAVEADEASRPIALQSLYESIEGERLKLGLLSVYWRALGPIAFHEQLLRANMPEQAETEIRAILDDVLATREQLAEQIDASLDEETTMANTERNGLAIIKTGTDALDRYNKMRSRWAEARGLATPESARPRLSREAPCGPATPGIPGKSVASRVDDGPMDDFYPAQMKTMGVEGLTIVRTEISETGCVLSVSVEQPSGAPALDEAALRTALTLTMRPAWRDGKAVASSAAMPWRFKLSEGR